MLLIGDPHGKLKELKAITSQHKGDKIQLGDLGFKKEHEYFLKDGFDRCESLFGNHDYYPLLHAPHSLGDYGFTYGIFHVRGAYSIDRHWRTEGVDWFNNEELSYPQFNKVLEYYEEIKPSIVISHDCPQSIRESWFGIEEKSTTSNGLQAMFEIHQPDLWVFGHHHTSKKEIVNGTRFVCLDELEGFLI